MIILTVSSQIRMRREMPGLVMQAYNDDSRLIDLTWNLIINRNYELSYFFIFGGD